MPYTYLYDAARVETQVASTVAAAAWANELQDQLKDMLGPLQWNIPMVGGIPGQGWIAASAADDWDYLEEPGTDPPYWSCQGATASKYLNIPIPFARKNFKMTRLYCVVSGDSIAGDDFDGSIKLKKNTISAAGGVVSDVVTMSTTPWRTASAWTLIDSGAISVIFNGEEEYRLVVASSGDATNRTNKLLGAYATVQFGS